MAKNSKADMSCARVKKYTSSDVSKAERHNERKNETYENMNVVAERIPYNVHFKEPTAPTYMEQLKQMEQDGKVSLRGLRKDATLFNEIVIDVNTMYFERNGGYEYAKQFYEEAFHFIEEKFGADNVISAVMHADEINLAATEDLGKEVYHYHLHAMVLPVVEKEILWSKRCKDPELRGTVKEVVNQISHSKKWKSAIPLVDEKGNPLLRKNGKPMFRASYSILQDELFNHMTEKGFKGFQRGEYGSTAEHLTSLQYQIKQDTQRLDKLQQRIQKEQVKYKSSHQIFKTYNEIDSMGQKTFTGKMAISKEDYKELTTLAKEGITSRAEIKKLEEDVGYYQQRYYNTANALENMKSRYNELKEKCRPFLQALEHFPEVAKLFTEKVKQLFSFKEAQDRAEKEAREKERQERIKARRKKRDMER
ncbi:plasmid recombination protein [Mediterraneibacter gnavus]|uniref:plasmid recombination protein n=1 Tax=Mediterraneibacter gnavus TaxID=33038 RepID=UPI0035662FC9